MITALFVETDGAYFNVPGVDPWDISRDARAYTGDDPVVAHPPCQRWSRLAALCEKRYGLQRGEDGGCFASALASVRRCGGVLEHPAQSAAWATHGLTKPPVCGGWIPAGDDLGFTCHVEQGHYGHKGRKPTWLYAVRCTLPSLAWGESYVGIARLCVVYLEDMPQSQRSVTPDAFKQILLTMARSVRRG